MKISNIKVYNMLDAYRAIRLSYEKEELFSSEEDPIFEDIEASYYEFVHLSEKDLNLIKKLIERGSSHRKFMRQIFVSMRIKAPMYWWKEMDTFKINTVRNSESTMHTLTKDKLTQEDFEGPVPFSILSYLNELITQYKETKDRFSWGLLINSLPSGFLQESLWTANYETLLNIIEQREGHPLEEWAYFIEKIKKLKYLIV